jgi:hypothetical protein
MFLAILIFRKGDGSISASFIYNKEENKRMKIAISSAGRDMNSQIDQRFGRCAYFIIVQTDDNSLDVFENEFKSLGGVGRGRGIAGGGRGMGGGGGAGMGGGRFKF